MLSTTLKTVSPSCSRMVAPHHAVPVVSRGRVATQAFNPLVTAIAIADNVQPGSVDAPIEYLIGGAVLVTLVSTAAVPLYLNRGQEAADQVFAQGKNKPKGDGLRVQKAKKK
mmetsp:Transcript_28458/g.58781  ORF Transcript_28458/g.58781 Transcript_28458/m.58781 type:complete len:112 (-) Transcript_28458:156-491(-)